MGGLLLKKACKARISLLRKLVNGSLTRDFQSLFFLMNQCPPGTQVFQWGRFEFLRTFAEIFANECLSQVSTTPAIICSAVSMTPVKNLFHNFSLFLPVSLTPLMNIHSQISLRIFEKIWNGPNGILRARGTLIYEKNLMSKISCQTPFNCSVQRPVCIG